MSSVHESELLPIDLLIGYQIAVYKAFLQNGLREAATADLPVASGGEFNN